MKLTARSVGYKWLEDGDFEVTLIAVISESESSQLKDLVLAYQRGDLEWELTAPKPTP